MTAAPVLAPAELHGSGLLSLRNQRRSVSARARARCTHIPAPLCRWKQDVALMKSLGIKHYRMSFSWPRLVPDGKKGTSNKVGIQFYNILINQLLANNITVYGTLYHWDLPQKLQVGAWENQGPGSWSRGPPGGASGTGRRGSAPTERQQPVRTDALPSLLTPGHLQAQYNGFVDRQIVDDFKWCAPLFNSPIAERWLGVTAGRASPGPAAACPASGQQPSLAWRRDRAAMLLLRLPNRAWPQVRGDGVQELWRQSKDLDHLQRAADDLRAGLQPGHPRARPGEPPQNPWPGAHLSAVWRGGAGAQQRGPCRCGERWRGCMRAC